MKESARFAINAIALGCVTLALCLCLPEARQELPGDPEEVSQEQGLDPLYQVPGIEAAYPRFATGGTGDSAGQPGSQPAKTQPAFYKTSSGKLPREAGSRNFGNRNAQNIQINGNRGFSSFSGRNGAQNIVINGGNRGFSGFSGFSSRSFSGGCRNQAQNIQINRR